MESKFVELNGLNYHYLEIPNAGKPKVLLVHGIIVESHYWESVMQVLAPHFHVFSIDLKGHGLSDSGKSYLEDYTTEKIAQDFYDFYQKVLKEPFHLVGYSLGGQFSMEYAAQYGSTLKSFVIVDSAHALSLKGVFALMLADIITPKVFANLDAIKKFYPASLGEYMAHYTVKQREDGKYILKFDRKNISPKSLSEGMRRNKRLWKCITQIKTPTLILRAGKSRILSAKTMKNINLAIPQSQTAEIPDVGHEFVFTMGEAVGNKLKDFFNQHP